MPIDLSALKALGKSSPIELQPARLPRDPVGHSRELDRILAIPRHPGYTDEDRAAIENHLRLAAGTMRLRPHQADALLAALETGTGIFAPLAVGAGKTLIAALLPTVLDARRAIVLTTAALEAQTRKLFKAYAEHFNIRRDIAIISYTRLSHPDHHNLLDRIGPNLIIADEAHALRDPKSARTKRFVRYLLANPRTLFVPLSGTMCKRSIKDYAHALHLSLREWSPLPRDYPTLTEWAEALDPEPVRAPGALARLCGPGEDARDGFARRLRQTRGVVSSPTEELGATLIIRIEHEPSSLGIANARRKLEATWERPDGEELTTALELAQVDHQLRLGGYYAWSTAPDRDWLRARKEYFRAVRQWLSAHARPGVDSPALLEHAIRRKEIVLPEFAAWAALRNIPEPPREWVWIDDVLCRWAANEAHAKQQALPHSARPTVIFCDLIAIGKRTAELAGVPYYGEGRIASEAILEETGTRSIVCSLQAHGQGRNLQCFSRALVLGAPPTGTVWEQMLGRLHRSGQTADEVEYLVPSAFVSEFDRASLDAAYIQTTTGQPQKLTIANIVRTSRP